jgi:hypothetical protein
MVCQHYKILSPLFFIVAIDFFIMFDHSYYLIFYKILYILL